MHIVALQVSAQTADTLRLISALLIPIIVGFVTKSSASSGLKALVNTLLAAVATAIAAIVSPAMANFNVVARNFISTAVTSFATYYGVWKPTGVAGAVAAKTSTFGVGTPTTDPPTPDPSVPDASVPDPVSSTPTPPVPPTP